MKSKQLLLLLLIALMAPWAAMAQETLTVYENTTTDVNNAPMFVYYFHNFTRTQTVFPAEDLAAMAGSTITAITFYTTNANIPYTTQSSADIYLTEVGFTNIVTYDNYIDKSSATIVKTGYFEFVSDGNGGGKVTITFDTPYPYNGGNLLFGCENTDRVERKEMKFKGITQDGASMGGQSTSYPVTGKNNRKFLPKTTFTYISTSYPQPDDLQVDTVTDQSATLTWQAPETTNTIVGYSYNYKEHSTSTWSTDYSVNVTEATLNNLGSFTEYDFRVKALYSGDNESGYTMTTFRTECGPITVTAQSAWTENFENFYHSSTTFASDVWSHNGAYYVNEGCWDVDGLYSFPALYLDTPVAFSGRGNLQFMNRGDIQILILPEFTNALNTLQFEFKGNYYNYEGVDNQGTLEIGYYDGNGFHAVCTSDKITTPRGSSGHNATGDYMGPYPLTGDIPSGSRMALRYTPKDPTIHTNTGVATGAINLDDFRVSITPPCEDPTNLAYTSVTATTASFSWTGSGDFEYVCVPQGNTPDWSNATSTSNTSVNLEGLSAGTNYDFYVRKVCVANLLFSDAVKVSFTTQTVIVTYTITVTSNDPTLGTVTGGGTYNDHETATLTATPGEGYIFTQWNDGNTDNPRSITVTGDASYVAYFEDPCAAITIVEGTPWTQDFEDGNFYYETQARDHNNSVINKAYRMDDGCWNTVQIETNGYNPILYTSYPKAAFSGGNSVQFFNRAGAAILILPEFTNALNTLQFEFKANYYKKEKQGTLEIGYYYGNTFYSVCVSDIIDTDRGPSDQTNAGTGTDDDYMGPYALTGNIPQGSRMALRYTPLSGAVIGQNSGNGEGCINLDDFRVSVTSTFTKTINGYGENEGGYCLIASPVVGVRPSVANGFVTDEFDLYAFNQSSDMEWINYVQTNDTHPFTKLELGKGYLYASQDTTTLTFAGTPNTNGAVTLSKTANSDGFEGYNLVGNPFGVEAYITKPYYRMNEGGADIMSTSSTGAIAVMEGVFVIADNDGETLTFSTTAPNSKSANLNLNLVKGSKVIDRAIVNFGNEEQLPKFQINRNSTKVYIPQEGKDYAIVSAESSMGEMPVNFKAENNGSYTLSFTSEEVSFAYLHLIDNMTGIETDLLATLAGEDPQSPAPSYTFYAKTTDYESRFKLVFATGNNANDDNFAFYSNGSFVINNMGEATLQVIDVNGRILKSESINGCANVNVKAAAGVYMLRLVNGNDVKVQKVVVR